MLTVEVVIVGPLETNCYLVCDDSSCVIIDPGDEAETILNALGNRKMLAVIATHLHFDHVGAVKELTNGLGVPFMVHKLDWELRDIFNELATEWGFTRPELPEPVFIDEGSKLPLNLKVMHTPGHTPGSVSIIGDGFVITGDTLFAGSVGRTDLPGGDMNRLRNSVCRLYRELPDNFIVYPGHGPSTTIGEEKLSNLVIPMEACLGEGRAQFI
ncbi:MBL fold metallo-hydrolase [Vulcanisaeta sp. JCM 16159]|uniref:MBL fold metallo-hydrolase n=1 Tax=Vulcanisaeta sp. JCM 16159 TaxID=1295371 RepID=UPI0006D27600|nr:MBL fold metallo-hydrolase [Vulcanisaeta sp. JCM 16159]